MSIWHVNAPVDMQLPNEVPVVSVADDANATAVYSAIASPPFDVGATHVTVAVVVLNVAATDLGALGAVTGKGAVTVEVNEEYVP